MKRATAATILATIGLLALAAPAYASTTVEWTGNGSENIPCADGGHWVLSPSQGITSATLTVDGTTYVMHQNGGGSFAADSDGAITADVEASATYEGDNDKAFLKLSHCIEGTSSTPPPTTPPPTTTPPATTPPETTPVPTRTTVLGKHSANPKPHRSTAFTGTPTWPIAGLVGFASLGLGSLALARRKSGAV
jgi:endoglucanase